MVFLNTLNLDASGMIANKKLNSMLFYETSGKNIAKQKTKFLLVNCGI